MSKILYVQVIEAREVTSRIATTALTPIVTVKYNGSLTNKKTTTYKQNKTYWAEIFTFSTENVKSDFVTFELREKGYHVLSSDWIGETQIKLSDYDDGNVHLKWFRLGESKLKQHTKRPRGVLLLKIHLTTKNDKPFYKKPVEKVLSYDEWLEWSEAHYAAKFKNASTSDDYYPKAEDVLPSTRSRSKSLSEESSSKKERKEKKEKREKKEKTEADPGIFSRDVAPASKPEKKKLSKSVSEKKVKSKPEANSAFDPSTSPVAGSIAKGLSQSSKDNGSQKGKMKPSGFPISPIVGSPAAKQAVVGDLIDFSDFVEVPTTKPQSYNPFSDVYLSNPFQNMNLQEKRSYNPFLEPNEQLAYAR